ncbi:L-asparaginase [Bradyrhizobium japonicum]|uniref:L-asparaginase n=1 Tax=Bradyrhizobium japonicum TaxID=375 RepID=A0ABV2RW11_BRAJP|nr:asparaginase [Bradyrhizobium japonicum]UQD95689.1 asparaginase [Bradyrhizobium japonicum]WLB22975.1 asparaginase [Bradyrhizobium japonicum]
MTKQAARPASRRRNRTLMLTVPLVALALWSWGIDAAQAAEPGKDATAAGLPRILVLATGGTIAGQADARATGAYKSGQITGEQLMQSVPGLDKLAKLNAEQISSIGSQDMNDKVWFALARRIQDAFDKNEADGILITHGTDTLEETAFFLDNVVRGDKPVVIVGSMRPATAVSADGPGNLYEAVQVAADPRSRGRGVMAVLNDKIQSARSITKTNTTSIETFGSPNDGPIGYVDTAGGIRFMAQAAGFKRTTYPLPAGEQLPRVEIVYSHANMDAVPIEDAISHGAKGIVLAGVGDGNTSKQALDALEAAAKKGIIVVRSTRVRSGFVTRNVEVDDDKNGFVVSEDLNPQKAVLTQLLIAGGVTAPAELQRAFTATW